MSTGAPDADLDMLDAAAALSRRFGDDPQYSRAGGGNSSAKTDDVLYIKPSGVSLASTTPEALMPLALAPLLDLASATPGADPPGSEAVMRTALAARMRSEGDRRPSVECVFHALIPSRFVVHTHPTIVNSLTCARDGQEIARELLGDDVLWVPYVDPGLPLAREIARLRREHATRTGRAAPSVTLLQNHGLIVAGDDPAGIVERSDGLVDMLRRHLDERAVGPDAPWLPTDQVAMERMSRVLGARLADGPAPRAVAFDESLDAAWLSQTAEGEAFVRGGPLTPDQIVYTGSWPLWLEAGRDDDEARMDALVADSLAAHVAATGERPIIAVVSGIGVFATGAQRRQAETARELYVDATRVARGALRLGGVRPLAPSERRFIETWEAEAYRRVIETQDSAGVWSASV